MAKRLSDTEKWMDSWFRRLPTNGKILWLYMLDRCDIAGVWEIDLDLFNLLTGSAATRDEMERDFGDRLHFFDGGRKVWIRRFIDFQNGALDEDSKSPIIRSILKTLKSHGLDIPYFKGINTLSNRDKEKERVKEEEKEKEESADSLKTIFDEARKAYPQGKKRGLEPEWVDFRKKHGKKVSEIVPLLLPGVLRYNARIEAEKIEPRFVKHFQGWLSESRWTEEASKPFHQKSSAPPSADEVLARIAGMG